MSRVTTVAIPGNPRRYVLALREAIDALEPGNPRAAGLLGDIVDAIDETLRARRAFDAIAKLHSRRQMPGRVAYCAGCGQRWPCPTMRPVLRLREGARRG